MANHRKSPPPAPSLDNPRESPVIHDDNFRAFSEAVDDLVLVADMEGNLLYVNPAACLKLGYSGDELLGMEMLDLHPTWCRDEARNIHGEIFTGRKGTCPLPMVTKKGSTIPVQSRLWIGEWNGRSCVFGLCKDLSHEQELHQKFEQFFRVNPAPMAISRLPDGVYLEVNEAFEEVLGYTSEEVLGHDPAELDLTPDLEDLQRAMRMLADYGHFRDLEMRVRTKDRSLRTGIFSRTVIESHGHRLLLSVMTDISKQKEAEKKLEESFQELRSAFHKIKTLQGILPICSCCKNIRDDQGYWEALDAYISRHTDARFTHGICPECRARLYPDLA